MDLSCCHDLLFTVKLRYIELQLYSAVHILVQIPLHLGKRVAYFWPAPNKYTAMQMLDLNLYAALPILFICSEHAMPNCK